jgi:undecaprenyl-diphosphatase
LLEKTIGKHLESIRVMALSLVIGGVIMWAVDAWSERRESPTKDVEQMSLVQAVWIGFCQIFSGLFPGTSRSMSTIAGGQLVGLTRPAALEFSFLVSIPTMVAATGYEALKVIHPSHHHHAGEVVDNMTPLVMTGHNWIVLAIGFVVSFFVALGVVEWFLQWVRKHGFVIFAVYRLIVGGLLLFFGARLFGA